MYLLIVWVVGSGLFAAGARASERINTFSVHAGGDFGILTDEDRRLLPISGSTLPVSGSTDGNGVARDTPQVSVVEAIPTPTAFHAGATMLAVIVAGRYYRKLRAQFSAAS